MFLQNALGTHRVRGHTRTINANAPVPRQLPSDEGLMSHLFELEQCKISVTQLGLFGSPSLK
jgi:hypothetical protein